MVDRVVRDHDRLAHQALGRPFTPAESALAAAMARAFGQGEHAFAGVAVLLQQWGVARPSGEDGAWSVDVLDAELRRINSSLDDAYGKAGFGA